MTDAPPPTASTTIRPRHQLDIAFAVRGVKTVRRRQGVHWWTTDTPEGVAAVAFRAGGDLVRADAWGTGTDWALTQLPALLGARDDDVDDFEPRAHPALASLLQRSGPAVSGSLRIGATGRWYEALTTNTIGQRVVTADAKASRERLCHRHGEPAAAGPTGAFPSPDRLLALADHDFHRVGIERSRARVLRVAAKYAERLERLDGEPAAHATEWLQRLPGVGPWTTGLTTAVAGGDPDAVPVGDFHLPRLVTFALTGEQNGTDETMLEALAPFAGHRQRVVRLVKAYGPRPNPHGPAPFRSDISRI
ncbi:MAG: hypothetical protein RIB98_02665 [Acidimicrobiales bacterium]